jgi:hypothetical protein
MNRTLQLLVFLAGLAGIAWVGAGYVGTNVLALAVTALIAALYATGALELRRFARAAALDQAVAALDSPPATLAPWLDGLPAGLRSAVRRRVDGVPRPCRARRWRPRWRACWCCWACWAPSWAWC